MHLSWPEAASGCGIGVSSIRNGQRPRGQELNAASGQAAALNLQLLLLQKSCDLDILAGRFPGWQIHEYETCPIHLSTQTHESALEKFKAYSWMPHALPWQWILTCMATWGQCRTLKETSRVCQALLSSGTFREQHSAAVYMGNIFQPNFISILMSRVSEAHRIPPQKGFQSRRIKDRIDTSSLTPTRFKAWCYYNQSSNGHCFYVHRTQLALSTSRSWFDLRVQTVECSLLVASSKFVKFDFLEELGVIRATFSAAVDLKTCQIE